MLTNSLGAVVVGRIAWHSAWRIVSGGCAVCCAIALCSFGAVQGQQSPARNPSLAKKATSPAVDPKIVRQLRIQSAPTAATGALAPLANTFFLHSRSTASKTIYLDFTGHVTTNTFWNSPGTSIVTAPFSLDGDPAFSNAELAAIQDIWQRVSECYSPFDMDVTTEEPPLGDLINSGAGDTRWGNRACVGTSTPSPAPFAGGVAFIGSFTWNSDTPCFIFPENLANTSKYIADGCVHECGHTLGLLHHGQISPPLDYFSGFGTGPTGWAPHMGVGYYKSLVQWSKGEYTNSNTNQDDLAIITTQNGFTYRPDDFGNSQAAAGAIKGTRGAGVNASVFTVAQKGVIELRTDSDWFKLTTGTGQLNLNAVGGPSNTMLDIQMDLYSSNGSLVASSNPVEDVTASISRNVGAGTYFVKIDGVGKGDPLVTGYSDYSSLGQYSISGTYTAPPIFPPSNVIAAYSAASKTLTLTGDTSANSVTVYIQPGSLKIEGANGASINNSASFTAAHSGKLVLNANMNAGNDSVSVVGYVGMEPATMTVNLGPGDDKAAFTSCKIVVLTVDGGPGADVVTTSSCTIGAFNKFNLP